MKRRPTIDPAGHQEEPDAVPAFVRCRACPNVRLKTNPWAHPCPAAERRATPVVIPLTAGTVVTESLYFGRTKPGG